MEMPSRSTLSPQPKTAKVRQSPARTVTGTKKRYSKTKLGCKTCKVRKIRCDETSPICNNCIKSGRRCDGVATAANKDGELTFTAPLTLTYFRPTQTGWLSQQELAHLDLFRQELIYSIVGPTGTPAWKRLILQAVHEEVALCHAVVAFSALGTNNAPSMSSMDSPSASESSMSTPPPGVSARENEFALKHYGKALEAMRHVYRYDDSRSINTALLCTLLCICFELRIREPAIALTHLEHGLQVIDSNLQNIDSAITAAFGRLDLQAAIFLGIRPPALNPERVRSQIFVFDGVFQEAEHVLASLANRAWKFIRSTADEYRYRDSEVPGDETIAESLAIDVALHEFNERYLQTGSSVERMSADQFATLRIDYLSTLITMGCCLCTDESAYDQYADSFVEIVNLACGVISRQQATKQRFSSGRNEFQLDMAVIHPLYTTALKCRSPVTRRRAIEALYSGPELEGAFEGIVSAKIAEKVVAFEESGVQFSLNKMREGELLRIPKNKLIHSVDIYIEPPQRKASVYFSRRLVTPDGSCGDWDNVREDIAW